MTLTIAYVTARRDPKIEWFLNSLDNQIGDDDAVICIDRLFHERTLSGILCYPPKPNVWQGPHRLTKEDWFAMANARNTALCLCETDYIVYVDDLSVLRPGWLDAVKEAMAGGYIVCGAYGKMKNLVVENGVVKSGTVFSLDTRYDLQKKDIDICRGGWLYGCSCGMPVEDLLEVGGWPEFCDGLGAEDYCLGIALKNIGKLLRYDKRMMTYESEEDHEREPKLRCTDKGVSPNDKSHAAFHIAASSKYFPNYFAGGMRALREFVLRGNEFPVVQIPDRDWYDGQLISEME